MKSKKVLLRVALAFGCFVLCAVLSIGILWNKELDTIISLKKVGSTGTLYSMDYKADYDLDEMLDMNIRDANQLSEYIVYKISHGLAANNPPKAAVGLDSFGCTSFHVRANDGDWLFARNFDYNHEYAVVVKSDPQIGYASISICDPYYLDLDADSLSGGIFGKVPAVGLIYSLMDGMNEKGLAICILELPKHPALPDTDSPDVYTTTVMRLVLDRCAAVGEAVEMLNNLDVCNEATDYDAPTVTGSAYHYHIADAQGNSVVIEFDYENGFKVLPVYKESDEKWQICTNHYLSDKFSGEGDELSHSWQRYETVNNELGNNGAVTVDYCMRILSDVSVENIHYPEYGDFYSSTQWSAIYNLSDLTVSVCMNRDYNSKYTFSLEE